MGAEMIGLVAETSLAPEADSSRAESRLKQRYLDELRALEARSRKSIERIYDDTGFKRHEPAFELLDQDLFAEESLRIWGLTPGQLALTGAFGRAVAGGGIDLPVGGASVMLASVVGAWNEVLSGSCRREFEQCFTRLRRGQDTGAVVDRLVAELEAIVGEVDKAR